jgi:hypothetical protein
MVITLFIGKKPVKKTAAGTESHFHPADSRRAFSILCIFR